MVSCDTGQCLTKYLSKPGGKKAVSGVLCIFVHEEISSSSDKTTKTAACVLRPPSFTSSSSLFLLQLKTVHSYSLCILKG